MSEPGTTGAPGGPGVSDASGPPGVSVVICAYTEDRWEDVLAAVASVRAQSRPALETLLVVDHNEVLLDRLAKEYQDTDDVRVLANAGPRGLSAGRNTGIAASRGGIVAFLDDDAVAERDWLGHFAEAYADPRVMAVGGRTEPLWASGRRPGWFPEEFDWVVGCTYRGLPPDAYGCATSWAATPPSGAPPSTRRAASPPGSDGTGTSVRWAGRRRSCASASAAPGPTRSC